MRRLVCLTCALARAGAEPPARPAFVTTSTRLTADAFYSKPALTAAIHLRRAALHQHRPRRRIVQVAAAGDGSQNLATAPDELFAEFNDALSSDRGSSAKHRQTTTAASAAGSTSSAPAVAAAAEASFDSAVVDSTSHFGDIMGGGPASAAMLAHFAPLERVVLTANGNLQRIIR